MISELRRRGETAALEKFGGFLDRAMGAVRPALIGQAPEVFAQGARAMGPGGALHWRNVFWPTIPGHPVMQNLGRAGTLLQAATLPSAVHQERQQGEGRMSSLLGGVGGVAGGALGATAGGVLGLPVGALLGRRLGLGVGHLLGSPSAQEAQQ